MFQELRLEVYVFRKGLIFDFKDKDWKKQKEKRRRKKDKSELFPGEMYRLHQCVYNAITVPLVLYLHVLSCVLSTHGLQTVRRKYAR